MASLMTRFARGQSAERHTANLFSRLYVDPASAWFKGVILFCNRIERGFSVFAELNSVASLMASIARGHCAERHLAHSFSCFNINPAFARLLREYGWRKQDQREKSQ